MGVDALDLVPAMGCGVGQERKNLLLELIGKSHSGRDFLTMAVTPAGGLEPSQCPAYLRCHTSYARREGACGVSRRPVPCPSCRTSSSEFGSTSTARRSFPPAWRP